MFIIIAASAVPEEPLLQLETVPTQIFYFEAAPDTSRIMPR
jgi:hypothetical protein